MFTYEDVKDGVKELFVNFEEGKEKCEQAMKPAFYLEIINILHICVLLQ
jgi:hypothetical protein